MKKKIFTLMTLLLCAVVGVKAAETIIFSAVPTSATLSVAANTSDQELTSADATITGGKMYVTSEQTSAKDLITDSKFVFTNNNTTFKIVLDESLAVGDKITINFQGGTKEGAAKGVWVTSSATRPGVAPACAFTSSSDSYQDGSYTVTSDDEYVGNNTFTLHRAVGSTQRIASITITRPDARTAVTLSFPEDSYAIMDNESFSAPVLTVTPAEAASEVAYTSSNTSVATVNASTGAIAITGIGQTIITAAISGSATYADASTSYTLKVKDHAAKEVTATWAFDTGAEGQTAVISEDDVFSINSVSVADMTYKEVGSDQGITGTKMEPKSQASDNKSQYVKFTLVPKKGITFTPTSVSFDAMRWATDGSNKLHYYIECGATSTDLGNINPNRNGKGNGWTHCSHSLSDINATKAEPLTLALYVYGLAPGKQISFANIVITGTYSGTPEDETMYTISTSTNIDGAGTITQTPAGESLVEGTSVSFTATPNDGYSFVNWTVNGNAEEGNPYEIASLAANQTIVANFKKLNAITFDKGGDAEVKGDVPATAYADDNAEFTIPKSYFLTKEGYTLTGWNDGVNDHATGSSITITSDVTLTPVFTANAVTLEESTGNVTVNWDFQKKTVGEFNKASGFFVTQATINGSTVDIPLAFDKTIYNSNWNDWAHTGSKPTLTIPAMKGMQITMLTYNTPTTSTIAGETSYEVTGSNNPYTVTYTYNGEASSIDIYLEDAGYIRTLTAVYPKQKFDFTVAASGISSYCSGSVLDCANFPAGIKAYKVTEVTNTSVKLAEITEPVAAGTGILLIGTGSETYTLPFGTTATADVSDNKLIGVNVATEVAAEEGHTLLALSNGKFVKMNDGTVAAHKAYLDVPTSDISGAKALDIIIGGETTGINDASRIMDNAEKDNLIFNLNGQRIATPQKGINIINGKKIIVK